MIVFEGRRFSAIWVGFCEKLLQLKYTIPHTQLQMLATCLDWEPPNRENQCNNNRKKRYAFEGGYTKQASIHAKNGIETECSKDIYVHICIYVHMHMDPVTRSNWSPACI